MRAGKLRKKPLARSTFKPPTRKMDFDALARGQDLSSVPLVALPTEDEEQAALVEWCDLMAHSHPELNDLYAVANGGARHPVVAMKLKKTGVKPGVPDLVLAVPIGADRPHHSCGLYIEMKRRKGGKVSPEQQGWIDRLRRRGYRVEVALGWDQARAIICDYLKIKDE